MRWPHRGGPWPCHCLRLLLLFFLGGLVQARAERPQEWRKQRSSAWALHLEDGANASDSAQDGAKGSESAKDEAFTYADTAGQIAKLKQETKQYEDQVKGPVVDTADMWLQENTRHEEFVKELSRGMDIEKQLVHKLRTEAKKKAEEKMKEAQAEAEAESNSTGANSTMEANSKEASSKDTETNSEKASSTQASSTKASSSGAEKGQSNATSSSK
ncbi:CanA1 [Symbiodinium sp. CCMP2456]|nr:CanA1 [Symbiodinium sp. CCMP2456]